MTSIFFAKKYFYVKNLLFLYLWSVTTLAQQIPIEANGFVEVEAENFIEQSKTEKRRWEKITINTPNNHAQSAGKNAYLECLPDTRVTHDDKLINHVFSCNTCFIVEFQLRFQLCVL